MGSAMGFTKRLKVIGYELVFLFYARFEEQNGSIRNVQLYNSPQD